MLQNGFYRRLNIIKFDKQFTDEERKAFQKSNIFTKEALEYLAYISVNAYKQLLESETLRLANEDESEELLSRYKKDNNSVLSFLDSARIKVMLEKGQSIDRPELYSEYRAWCADNGYKTKGRNRFYSEVQDTGLVEIKFADGYPKFRRKDISF